MIPPSFSSHDGGDNTQHGETIMYRPISEHHIYVTPLKLTISTWGLLTWGLGCFWLEHWRDSNSKWFTPFAGLPTHPARLRTTATSLSSAPRQAWLVVVSGFQRLWSLPLLWPKQPGRLAFQLQSELLECRIHGLFNTVAADGDSQWVMLQDCELPVLLSASLLPLTLWSWLGKMTLRTLTLGFQPRTFVFSCIELVPLLPITEFPPWILALWPVLKRIP